MSLTISPLLTDLFSFYSFTCLSSCPPSLCHPQIPFFPFSCFFIFSLFFLCTQLIFCVAASLLYYLVLLCFHFKICSSVHLSVPSQTWSQSPPQRSWPTSARSWGRQGKCQSCYQMRWNWPKERKKRRSWIQATKVLTSVQTKVLRVLILRGLKLSIVLHV